MKEKRLYSLALAGYIMTITGLKPEIMLDTETNTAYCRYPESEDVANAIREFREGDAIISLNKYNANIRYIKSEFKKLTDPIGALKKMFE